MAKSTQSRLLLWNPFSDTTFIHGGRDGLIVVVSTNIVLKLPWRFEDDTQGTKHRKVKNSLKHFRYEKAMYEILNANPHPNILQSFLSTADGIFLPRMPGSLDSRLKQQNRGPVSEREKYSWMVQISSAAAWLEHLGYFHGDLRPPNILLDAAGQVKICDFANMAGLGQKNPGATAPFYITEIAGPVSEQFAIGSCIYTIFKGHDPLHELDYNEQCDALEKGEFPSLEGMQFGYIISDCWHTRYKALEQVQSSIVSALQGYEYENGASLMQAETYNARVAECQEFVEMKRIKPSTEGGGKGVKGCLQAG